MWLTRLVLGLLVLVLLAMAAIAAEGTIHNDTVWHDTNGEQIWCNGGHMIREGNTFYWVGYETKPGKVLGHIKLYSSTNLVDWRFENDILRKTDSLSGLRWAGRPALLRNRRTGKYVVIFEAGSPQWYRHKVGFASCDSIRGDYRLKGFQYPERDRSTGDQSVYQEGDDAYLVTVMDASNLELRNYSLAIYKLSNDFLRIESKIFEGFQNRRREAPHIITVGNRYYWFTSGLQYWNSTATMYSTSDDLAGPWTDLIPVPTEPESDDSFNTQHDFVVKVSGTEDTTYVYVGDRYSQHHGVGEGRNIFLPLIWQKGVPTLLWRENWKVDVSTGRHSLVR